MKIFILCFALALQPIIVHSKGVTAGKIFAACSDSEPENQLICHIYLQGVFEGIYALGVDILRENEPEYANDANFIGITVGFCKYGEHQVIDFVDAFTHHVQNNKFTHNLAASIVAKRAWKNDGLAYLTNFSTHFRSIA